MKITDQTTVRELEDALEREGFTHLEASIARGTYLVKMRHFQIGNAYGTGASLAEALRCAYAKHLDQIEEGLKP